MFPVQVLHVSDFGNIILVDIDNAYWRICPEELSCEVIADHEPQFEKIWSDASFQQDWKMDDLVESASLRLGPLIEHRIYGLTIPAVLGGEYHSDNIRSLPLFEYIRATGSIAFQIKDLKDGDKVVINVTN